MYNIVVNINFILTIKEVQIIHLLILYLLKKMSLNPSKINWFLLLKLPSAWICGVRLKSINLSESKVTVKHRWINQNPFRSMYFAVQNMAAELSTGVLVMQAIKAQKLPVSMLVLEAQSEFFKKATGLITFQCHEGQNINKAVKDSIENNESREISVDVEARNTSQDLVSRFKFKWSVKPKK